MPTTKKIIAASFIVFALLIIKWSTVFLPLVIEMSKDFSFLILFLLLLLLVSFTIFKLIRILVQE